MSSDNANIRLLEQALEQAHRQAQLGEAALTKLQETKQELMLYRKIFLNTSESVMITSAEPKIIEINPAFTLTTGYKPEEVIGKNPSVLHSGRQDEDFYETMWQQLQEQGRWEGEIWNRRKSGEIFPEWLLINAIYNKKRKITHYVGLLSDITQKKLEQEELEGYAYHDPLTGLPNRRTCMEELNAFIKTAKRYHQSIAVIFLDLDHFKPINDRYGHQVGDDLLIHIAKCIQGCLRDEDVVARIGGDEFVVIIKQVSSRPSLLQLAQQILGAVRKPVSLAGHNCQVGSSLGISLFPDDAETADVLMSLADKAMYYSKEHGRNCVTLYETMK